MISLQAFGDLIRANQFNWAVILGGSGLLGVGGLALWRRGGAMARRGMSALGVGSVPLGAAMMGSPLGAAAALGGAFVGILDLNIWLILTLALSVRLPRLNEPMWYDETFTFRLSTLPIQDLFGVVLSDVHPPLWYLLSWLLTHLFGASALVLRLPSLALGLLAIWLFWRVMVAIKAPPSAALLGALLVTLSPSFVYYSVEARQYSALICAVLLACWGLIDGRGWLLGVGMALVPWLHAYGFIYAALFGVMGLINPQLRRAALVGGLVGALWLPFALYQQTHVSGGFWIQSISPFAPFELIGAAWAGAVQDSVVLPVLIPISAVSVVALWQWRKFLALLNPKTVLVGIVAVGVPVAAALVSMAWHSIWLVRALIPCSLLMLIPIALALDGASMGRRVARGLFLSSLALGVALPQTRAAAFDDLLAGCDSLYAIDLPSAFIAYAYSNERPLTVYWAANDLNQTLDYPTKDKLFNLVDLPQPGDCIVNQSNPLVSGSQIMQLRFALVRGHYILKRVNLGESRHFYFEVYHWVGKR